MGFISVLMLVLAARTATHIYLALSTGTQQVIGVVMVASITALATYIVDRWKNSGNIESSTASDLWTESTRMRVELRDQVARVTAMYDEERKARIEAEDRERALLQRVAVLENEVSMLKAQHG